MQKGIGEGLAGTGLAKERGFTLEGAKTHLKEEKQKSLETFEIINKLEHVKAQLLKIKEQL